MVTQSGIEKFKRIFNFLNKKGHFEIIINSWGALELVQEFINLEPVLGRNLTKTKKDPRINFNKAPFKESVLLQKCSLTNTSFTDLLKEYRINKIEIDNVPQGLKMNFKQMNLSAHLNFPTIPVTFSKPCLIGSTNRKSHRFAADGPCRKECQDYTIACHGPINGSEKDGSLFHDFNVEYLGRGVYMTNENLDRINIDDFNRLVFCF
jgi:hypothetical protein